MAKHPIDTDVAQNLDVNQWAKDSYEISASFVYEGKFHLLILSDVLENARHNNRPKFN